MFTYVLNPQLVIKYQFISCCSYVSICSAGGAVFGRANDRGVTLGLEVVNRYESNLINTAAQVRVSSVDVF